MNRFPGSRDRVPRRNTPVASAYLGLIAVSTLYQLWSRRCVLLERLFD